MDSPIYYNSTIIFCRRGENDEDHGKRRFIIFIKYFILLLFKNKQLELVMVF